MSRRDRRQPPGHCDIPPGLPGVSRPAVIQPLIGNALLTLGFLLTGSPGAAIVGHVIMHAAAVVHGMETTVQLPPHY